MWERGLIQTLHFEPQPYIYIYIFYLHKNYTTSCIDIKVTNLLSTVKLNNGHNIIPI